MRRIAMNFVITPAIFLSASILGRAQSVAPPSVDSATDSSSGAGERTRDSAVRFVQEQRTTDPSLRN